MKSNKNKDNFDEIARKYYRSIFNYCFVKLGKNKESAEDCTQEVFMTLFKKMDTLEDFEQIRPWLYQTASFVVKNYVKVNAKKQTENIDDYENTLTAHDDGFSKLERNEILELLEEDDRDFADKYYIQQIPVKNLAKIFGISETAVYKRASRIKLKLSKKLRIS